MNLRSIPIVAVSIAFGMAVFGGSATTASESPKPVPAAGASAQAPPTLSAGDVVPEFDAERIDGTRLHVGFPKKGDTVLLFFLSSCPVCHRMIPLWNQAFARRRPELQIVGVILDREIPGFFETTPVAFPVVRSPGKALLDAYKIKSVPVTMRIGGGGRVADVGVGPLDPIRVGELLR